MQVDTNDHTSSCLEDHLGRRFDDCVGCSHSYVSKRQQVYAWLQGNRSAEELSIVHQILTNLASGLQVQ